jgi:hypothetical protein
MDPQEARAVSEGQVRGTLPERIEYLHLIRYMHFSPDADFDFQSSLQGGRLELGGIVADFLFPYMRIIIRVQGPSHTQYLRSAKDEEQRAILEDMGYLVWDLDLKTIFSPPLLEDWHRIKFGLMKGTRGGGAGEHSEEEQAEYDADMLNELLALTEEVLALL